jgi:hypothetical protein
MQNVAIQKASELPPAVRSAVEQLLGRRVEADEEVSVVVVPPQQAPISGNSAATVQGLEAFLERRAEKVRDVPEKEIDAAIDEAASQVRRRRR